MTSHSNLCSLEISIINVKATVKKHAHCRCCNLIEQRIYTGAWWCVVDGFFRGGFEVGVGGRSEGDFAGGFKAGKPVHPSAIICIYPDLFFPPRAEKNLYTA